MQSLIRARPIQSNSSVLVLETVLRSRSKRPVASNLFKNSVDFDSNPIVHGERSLNGIFGYQTGPPADRDYQTVLRLLARNEIDPEPLVTSRIDHSAIVEDGFEQLLDRSSGQVKVLVSP